MIHFACPRCGRDFAEPESAAGTLVVCPECHTGIGIPTAQSILRAEPDFSVPVSWTEQAPIAYPVPALAAVPMQQIVHVETTVFVEQAPAPRQRAPEFPHLFHIAMVVLTGGLWLPVYLIHMMLEYRACATIALVCVMLMFLGCGGLVAAGGLAHVFAPVQKGVK